MNDNQENQQNETTKPKLLERIQAEYDQAPQRALMGRYNQTNNLYAELSDEDREKAVEVDRRMYEIKAASERYFVRWINTPNPMNALMAAHSLAYDYVLRSNTAMIMILKHDDSASKEDYSKIIYEIDSSHAMLDNARLVRFLANDYNINNITLAECYWLLQFATYLNCATPDLTSKMFTMLNADTNLQDLIFQQPLVLNATQPELALKQAAFNQYQHLEALLKRIS